VNDAPLYLNQLPHAEAERALFACCASRAWVKEMLARRPYGSRTSLFAAADAVWEGLGKADYLEAFAGHPKIGEDPSALRRRFAGTARWSNEEQAGVAAASDQVLARLHELNLEYERRFGYIFIVCATGKSASEMLTLLEARLDSPAEGELQVAAAEQAKITKLRLEKLEATPGEPS
jgi:2-oxo-4-hydroxy-4-carboxy-5-ureidoimidazoline decarboxylase